MDSASAETDIPRRAQDTRGRVFPYMRRFSLTGLLFLVAAGLSPVAPAMATSPEQPPTRLGFRLATPEGEWLLARRAEVLLTSGQQTNRVGLVSRGLWVQVPLGPRWPQVIWPERADELREARIRIEVEGFAPLVSKPFTWLTQVEGQQTIEFHDGQRFTVSAGESTRAELIVRRTEPPAILESVCVIAR